MSVLIIIIVHFSAPYMHIDNSNAIISVGLGIREEAIVKRMHGLSALTPGHYAHIVYRPIIYY